MTSFVTGTSSSASTSATCTFTIPAGVAPGDIVLVGFAVFCEVATAPTIAFSGGSAGTWALLSPMHTGANPEQAASGGGLYSYGYVYSKQAASGDPGATVTLTETGSPSATTWWAVVLGVYAGASTTQPDIAGASVVNNAVTGTSPAETTGVSGDWSVEMLLGGVGTTGTVGAPATLTTRESVVSGAGIAAVLADSNGSVGGAGTSIGGETWTGGNSSPNNTFALFTIGLAPAGGSESGPFSITLPVPTVSLAGQIGHNSTFNIRIPAPVLSLAGHLPPPPPITVKTSGTPDSGRSAIKKLWLLGW